MLLSLVLVPRPRASAIRGSCADGRGVPSGSPPRGSCRQRRRRGSRWRRHLPFALFAAALAVLCVALARPTMSLALPQREGTVILAFDVSNSMLADDLEPSRIEAAKAAATRVRRSVSRGRSASVWSRSATARSPCCGRPTSKRTCSRPSTPVAGWWHLARSGPLHVAERDRREAAARSTSTRSRATAARLTSGYYGSSTIVLLSDGENTSGPTRFRSPRSRPLRRPRPRRRRRAPRGDGGRRSTASTSPPRWTSSC